MYILRTKFEVFILLLQEMIQKKNKNKWEIKCSCFNQTQ
jgi:hypothetical protein